MGGALPNDGREKIIDPIKNYCLEATNMTEEQAYDFAFRCWQLNFVKMPKSTGNPLATIRNINYISDALLDDIKMCLLSDINISFEGRDMCILQEALNVMQRLEGNIVKNLCVMDKNNK